MDVTNKKIYGKGINLYLVCWSRSANFGYNLMNADTERDAYNNHPFSKNKEVNFIITKIDSNNMPVIFKESKRNDIIELVNCNTCDKIMLTGEAQKKGFKASNGNFYSWDVWQPSDVWKVEDKDEEEYKSSLPIADSIAYLKASGRWDAMAEDTRKSFTKKLNASKQTLACDDAPVDSETLFNLTKPKKEGQ